MYEVNIDLCDALTPRTCSKLLVHLIKYVLYQLEQIPMNYESLNCFLNKCKAKAENGNTPVNTVSQMKARKFFNAIDTLLTTCEKTFQYLENEILQTRGIKELVIVVGTTVLSPKKIIRITIPNMSFDGCIKEHSTGRNMQSLCRNVVMSDALHEYFKDKVAPTNIYIFLKVDSSHHLKTNWFLPKEEFRFSKIGKQIKINLEQPTSNLCPCLESAINLASNGENILSSSFYLEKENFLWYQFKDCLKGLTEKGNHSLFSLLSTTNVS